MILKLRLFKEPKKKKKSLRFLMFKEVMISLIIINIKINIINVKILII